MPRRIQAVLPCQETNAVIDEVRNLEGVVGVSIQRAASIKPPGDIVTIQATNEGSRAVLAILDDHHATDHGSIETTEPKSLFSNSFQNGIERESNETTWEEMAFLLRRETNVSFTYVALMALAGTIAAMGLWSDTLHLVIGAMVIAPGFEPLLRIPFGLIAGPRVLSSRGVWSTVAGYLAMAVAAGLMVFVMAAVAPAQATPLASNTWVQYWSTITPSGFLLAVLAGAAGAVTILSQRSVLSAGVMIALALIPAISIAGMALVSWNLPLATGGLLRWGTDAAGVLIGSSLILGLRQLWTHRRQAIG